MRDILSYRFLLALSASVAFCSSNASGDTISSRGDTGDLTGMPVGNQTMLVSILRPVIFDHVTELLDAQTGLEKFGLAHTTRNGVGVYALKYGSDVLQDTPASDMDMFASYNDQLCSSGAICDTTKDIFSTAATYGVSFDCSNVADSECKKECNTESRPGCMSDIQTSAPGTGADAESDESSTTSSSSSGVIPTTTSVLAAVMMMIGNFLIWLGINYASSM